MLQNSSELIISGLFSLSITSKITLVPLIFIPIHAMSFLLNRISLIIAFAAKLENIGLVLISTALTAIIFTLLGLIVAARIKSLNQYILITVPIETVCVIPPIIFLFAPTAAMRWFPLNGSISLIANSSQNILLDVSLLLGVIVCLWVLAYRTTLKMWKSLGGVKL